MRPRGTHPSLGAKTSFKGRMILAYFLGGNSEEFYFFLGSLIFLFYFILFYGHNVCKAETELCLCQIWRNLGR